MVRRKTQFEVSGSASVPVSFVDLFACGFGAVALYWLLLVATLPTPGRLPGRGTVLQLAVQPIVEEQLGNAVGPPQISVVAVVNKQTSHPDRVSDVGGPAVPKIFPELPGSPKYSIIFRSNEAQPDDAVIVHLHDLSGWEPTTTFRVDWSLAGQGVPSVKRNHFLLSAVEPIRSVPLPELLDPQQLQPTWNAWP